MKLKLKKKYFKTLLKAVYLADNVRNPIENKLGKKGKRYQDLMEILIEQASPKELKAWFSLDKKGLSQKKEDKYFKILAKYDNYSFWSQLSQRMAYRDMKRNYSKKELSKMTLADKLKREEMLIASYEEEFRKNGLLNLNITRIKQQ